MGKVKKTRKFLCPLTNEKARLNAVITLYGAGRLAQKYEAPETTGDIADDENKSSPATKTVLLSQSEFYDGNDLLTRSHLPAAKSFLSHFSALGRRILLLHKHNTAILYDVV